MATAKITLTDRESQLRTLLLDVARYIDESKEIKEKIELRFAGGWVRDKLLDIPSHDIDTAINAMTGFNFGMKMKEYLGVEENLKKHNLEKKDVKTLHTIAANPEKSKHLETATTRILGFEVDFVNLRKEIYEPGNRNPKMEFGTPKEDAERRDATINALFYNLHSDQVEDFEGGLADLEAKVIRTPLEPNQTFKDDPLRVLRLIRFASRLDFQIDPESAKHMKDPEILKDLGNPETISRERIGVELEKMLKGNDPRRSLQYFDDLKLYSVVFTDPTRKDGPNPSTVHWNLAYTSLSRLQKNETPDSIYKALVGNPPSKDASYQAWILAALVPWASVPNPIARKTTEKRDPTGTDVAREGIKLEGKLCEIVRLAYQNQPDIIAAKDAFVNKENWVNERHTLGMKIRDWGVHWKVHVLFALLFEAMEQKSTVQQWQEFIDHVKNKALIDVATAAYPINGHVLSKGLGIKPGAWMKEALNVCMEWRLKNPENENIEDAIEEVRQQRERLGIPRK